MHDFKGVRGRGAVSWFSEKGLRLYLPGRDESITSRVVDRVLRDVDGMIEFGRHGCAENKATTEVN